MTYPQRFGRYLLLDRVAVGGMAEIFLAKLEGLAGFEKLLAIKRILPHWSTNHDFITMLIDEAKIVVQLVHPNIVSVYELGKEEQSYYIAMEYVEGVDLRRLFEACQSPSPRLPLPLAVQIIVEVLRGLAYAHRREGSSGERLEIVHRDISPQNILLSYDGQVKITDFGIARAANRSTETATGTLKGKYAYMSPEQACQEPVDARSDLFSVGVLLYELFCGVRLFARATDLGTLEAVRDFSRSYWLGLVGSFWVLGSAVTFYAGARSARPAPSAQSTRFEALSLPALLAPVFVAAGAVTALTPGTLRQAAGDVLIPLVALYFVAGLSIICHFARKWFRARILRIGLYTLVIYFPLSVAVALLGLFDWYASFRRRGEEA